MMQHGITPYSIERRCWKIILEYYRLYTWFANWRLGGTSREWVIECIMLTPLILVNNLLLPPSSLASQMWPPDEKKKSPFIISSRSSKKKKIREGAGSTSHRPNFVLIDWFIDLILFGQMLEQRSAMVAAACRSSVRWRSSRGTAQTLSWKQILWRWLAKR